MLVPDGASIQEVGASLRGAAEEATDLLLVYYAGHGLLSRRRHELHLALRDTPADEPGFGGLLFELVRDACVDSPARCKIVILDCCFSGRALGTTQSTPEVAITQEVTIEGVAVLASVPANAVALVLEDELHPAFSGRLLQLLRGGWPGGPDVLTLPLIHQRLQHELKAVGVRLPQIEYSNTIGGLGLYPNLAAKDARPVEGAAGTAEQLSRVDPHVAAAKLADMAPSAAAEVLELMRPGAAADALNALDEIPTAQGNCGVAEVLYEMEPVLASPVLGALGASAVAEALVRLLRHQVPHEADALSDLKVGQLLSSFSLPRAAAVLSALDVSNAADLLTAVLRSPTPAFVSNGFVRSWAEDLLSALDEEFGLAVFNRLPTELVDAFDT